MDVRKTMGVFVVVVSACGVGIAQHAESPTVVQGAAADPQTVGLDVLPASFEGDLPSADGPRILHHLDLFPGRVFVLRRQKLGPQESPPLDGIGTWMLSADSGRLMLKDAHRVPIVFAIADSGDLLMLDEEGRVMQPDVTYSLARLESFLPVEPLLFLAGMYRYTADGGVFRECRTGWRLPIANAGTGEALGSAYANTRHEPGEPLFASLWARIVERPPADGAKPQMMLVPEQIVGIWSGETCSPARPAK